MNQEQSRIYITTEIHIVFVNYSLTRAFDVFNLVSARDPFQYICWPRKDLGSGPRVVLS